MQHRHAESETARPTRRSFVAPAATSSIAWHMRAHATQFHECANFSHALQLWTNNNLFEPFEIALFRSMYMSHNAAVPCPCFPTHAYACTCICCNKLILQLYFGYTVYLTCHDHDHLLEITTIVLLVVLVRSFFSSVHVYVYTYMQY
jgi:hypothetical protein